MLGAYSAAEDGVTLDPRGGTNNTLNKTVCLSSELDPADRLLGFFGVGTNGSVRAVQSLSGTKMEVGHANADGTTGTYGLRLPTAAPASVAYAASAAAFTFMSDLPATAGKYRLEATTPTVTTPLPYVLTLTGDTTVPNFAFP